jgi:antitoxin CptB
LIVGRFADAFIDKLDEPSLDDFEHLIEAPNAELYAWVVGDEKAPADYDTAVLHALIGFHAQNPSEKAGEGPQRK